MNRTTLNNLKLITLLTLLIIALSFIWKNFNGLTKIDFGRDFIAYWASTHILINGDNPYSSDTVLFLQKSIGWPVFDNYYSITKEPIVMYNPPYTFSFLIPFFMKDFSTAIIIWIFCLLLFVLFSADRLWLIYGGDNKTRLRALITVATFIPGLLTLQMGNAVPIMLIGIMGFMYFIKMKKWWFAGMITILITFKPPQLYLFWIALLFWMIKNRNLQFLTGSLLMLLCVLLIPLYFNSNVYIQYFNEIMTKSYTHYWATPTLGTFLRLYLGKQRDWLQYLPALFGLSWFYFHWHKYRENWVWENQVPILINVSLMTNFYTWPSDYLLLLPGVIQASVRLYKHSVKPYAIYIIIFYIIINVLVFLSTISHIGTWWYIWIPYALLINYIFAMNMTKSVATSMSPSI